jgi:hypothetical protein
MKVGVLLLEHRIKRMGAHQHLKRAHNLPLSTKGKGGRNEQLLSEINAFIHILSKEGLCREKKS